MLFADNPHDRQIEKLMSQIPNFKPRGHGIYIYEEKEYSAENCFCRECTYRRKKKRNDFACLYWDRAATPLFRVAARGSKGT